MNLIPFLSQAYTSDAFVQIPRICFAMPSTDYPYFFCIRFIERFARLSPYRLEVIDLETVDSAALIAQLEMSFLGNQMLYWIRNVHTVSGKEGKQLIAYLHTYQGPHCLIFFASQEAPASDNGITVTLPEVLTKQQCMALLTLEFPEAVRKSTPILAAYFAKNATISLHNAYVLMHYVSVIGTSQQAFIQDWLGVIIAPEKSLFTLSTYFFAKDSAKFFALWSTIASDYSEPFWVVFWSEQVWRAAQYSKCMESKDALEAKKIAYRLPFSFMQRDWKKTNFTELSNAHAYLYTLDYALKNGGNPIGLELFYIKFFAGMYK
jgi:hypothetical protein